MSKTVYVGLEGQGKTLLMALHLKNQLKYNKTLKEKYNIDRPLYTNLRINPELSSLYPNIKYYQSISDVIGLTGCDIFHDELSSDFNAQKREPLPRRVNRWLRQTSKSGVTITCTAQEFHDLHLDFRRRVSNCYEVKKVIGSRRGGHNLPPVRFIWGLLYVRELNIHPYNELDPQYKSLFNVNPIHIMTRDLCNIFDTHQYILPSDELPLEHRERHCPTCGFKKVYHS
jgi:hypothetical protein